MLFPLLVNCSCYGQKVIISGKDKIKNIVTGFLTWYKTMERDTAGTSYRITKGGYPDTTTKVRIDLDGVEKYLDLIKQSQLVSETYTDGLRMYFVNIDKMLANSPKTKALVKIPGLDIDFVLKTFEPEMILDHIKEGHFDRIEIIYDKAIARFIISKTVQMIFTLTREKISGLLIILVMMPVINTVSPISRRYSLRLPANRRDKLTILKQRL